ncbi:MAG: TetR/AcrR family transcriptional regulator [Actinobacteria bacterium]|nr:TetR/AcrR family transcriptional regulator [Actinomycetota bacterium]
MSTAPTSPPSADRPRRRARRGEGERTREEILAAAEALLARSGSEDAVSIRAVADAVGVTPPSIYRHFPDKAHLIFEVCARRFEEMDRHVVSPILAADLDPVDAIVELGRAYVRFGLAHPEHYRLMFMVNADHSPELYAEGDVVDGGSLGRIVVLLQHAIDAGRIRPEAGDAVVLTYVLWAALHGIVSLAIGRPNLPGPSVDEQVDAMIDAVLHGIVVPPPAGSP